MVNIKSGELRQEFETKGQNLLNLTGKLKNAEILPVFLLKHEQLKHATLALTDFLNQHKNLIVRSSASFEDASHQSMAGKYLSIANVNSLDSLLDAIDQVFRSYGDVPLAQEEVLIQPMLENVAFSGVLFSRDPAHGGDYFVVNYDASGSTDSVTNGSTNDVKTCYIAWGVTPKEPFKRKLVDLTLELGSLFCSNSIDIEFAVDEQGAIYLLQVRPLVINVRNINQSSVSSDARERIKQQLNILNRPHPYLFGRETLYGVMPDWNPAEIIGVRPKPLALSLYKELVTDSIWAYQRNNYGYLNLRSFPLLTSFCGLPYVDVRVSFNSFVPKDTPEDIAEKLVSYYIQKLKDNPAEHDKVEFNIVLSCYTLDIESRLLDLKAAGFSDGECQVLCHSLRELTNRIIDPRTGLWIQDFHKLDKLRKRQRKANTEISDLKQLIYWQLEDCKRYGTLPFAGLARAAFIAVQLLQSLVNESVISQEQYHCFMNSLTTVGSEMSTDFKLLTKEQFIDKYGHLRPGTYDIESLRYDASPESYFDWSSDVANHKKAEFKLTKENYQRCTRLLEQHRINHSVDSLFHFIRSAIEGRELAKFIFTRSLSDAMENIAKLCHQNGFSRQEAAFVDVAQLLAETFTSRDIFEVLRNCIEKGKQEYQITRALNLPPLLATAEEVDCFDIPVSVPNFITQRKITAAVTEGELNQSLTGKIVFITHADPGYDWLFSHSIAGLVTQFGGCNSHMAIRANELEIPAVIGAGETLYNKWRSAESIEIDALNKKVTVVR